MLLLLLLLFKESLRLLSIGRTCKIKCVVKVVHQLMLHILSAMEIPRVIRAAHVHNSQPKKIVRQSCIRDSIAGTVTLTAASGAATVTMNST